MARSTPISARSTIEHSSPAGLAFLCPDYQLGGYGLRQYTVPWSSAKLVLSAYGDQLLT